MIRACKNAACLDVGRECHYSVVTHASKVLRVPEITSARTFRPREDQLSPDGILLSVGPQVQATRGWQGRDICNVATSRSTPCCARPKSRRRTTLLHSAKSWLRTDVIIADTSTSGIPIAHGGL